MSLFDLIRYPVTIDFKSEDLERLPDAIYAEWHRSNCEAIRIEYFRHAPPTSRRETLSFIFVFADIKLKMPVEPLRQYVFHSLKKIIAEYDN